MGEANRIRIKVRGGKPLSGSFYRYWPQNSPHPDPVVHYSSNYEPYTVWRYMLDTHGFLQDDFNPCYHERYVGVHNFPSRISWTASDGVHAFQTTYRRQLRDPVASCRSMNLPLGTWVEDFGARAENHFITLVKTEYSLINFIIEMIELCEGNISILEKAKNAIEDAIKRFRKLFAETGNYWLSWNFAIKPTIADVKAMFSLYSKALKRLKWLRERNHKDTKVKYREGPREFEGVCQFDMRPDTVTQPYYIPTPVLLGKPPNQIWEEWADWLGLQEVAEVEYTARVRLSAWAWIRFDIPDMYLEGLPALGIVLSAMQGLYNPLAIGWEAVPFSWLIDWFRTEAHKLRELVKSDLNPLGHATIKAAGWTSDTLIFGTYYHRCGMTCAPGAMDPQPSYDDWTKQEAGAFRYKLYNRQPGLPETDALFRIPWEWYNASILTSLIQQKRRRG